MAVGPSDAVPFLVLGGSLVCVALFAMVWLRVGYAALGAVVRALHRVGLVRADESRRTRTGRSGAGRDRGVLLFTRALRVVSRLVPGDPGSDARPVVVPLLMVGVPVVLAALLVLWAVPLVVFQFVVTHGPDPWRMLLGVVAYFGGVLTVASNWRRVPAVLASLSPR